MPDENTNNEESSESAEDILNRQREEQLKEDEEDEEEFHLHMGKIIQINSFFNISSISWDKSYDSPTATSKVEIHYPKDKIKDLIRYVYKGVSCKAKLRRSTDKEFKTTKIEEYGLGEDEIRNREHYPTKEQKEEANAEMNLDELLSDEEQTIKEEAEETKPKTRSDSDAGVYGFVTDVNHKQNGTELEIKDWGFALEDKTKKLSFDGRLRSQILEEVIKTYGLVPVVDFTGLRDDIISWNNISQTDDEEEDSGTGGKIIGNDAIEIGNSLASNYGFCAGANSEDYESMKAKGCGSCWAWSDALYTELTRIGYTCRIVQYPTSQSSRHRSVQIKENGAWNDYPYRNTNIPNGAYSTSGSSSGQVIRSSEQG